MDRRKAVVLWSTLLHGCSLGQGHMGGAPPPASEVILTKHVQVVKAVTLTLWSEPTPLQVGENHIFLNVNAPTMKSMVNRSILLIYRTRDQVRTTPMRPVGGTMTTYKALIELDSPGEMVLSASVQSPTKLPVIGNFEFLIRE